MTDKEVIELIRAYAILKEKYDRLLNYVYKDAGNLCAWKGIKDGR